MAYTNFDDSGCTLTVAERGEEAKRILERIRELPLERLGSVALEFVEDKLDEIDATGSTFVSVKQLFWLRDIADRME